MSNLARLSFAILLVLLGAGGLEAQTNLLRDASFEQHQITANSQAQDPSGTGWTFSGNAGLINGLVSGTTAFTTLMAEDENQFLYLRTARTTATTNTDGQVTQTVTFPVSGNYTLTLWSALRDSNSASFNTTWTTYYMVRIDGTAQNSSTEMDVGGDQHATSDVQFNQSSLTFYVTSGTHTITLVSGGPTSGDTMTFIDNVSLAAAATRTMSQVAITSVPQSMETNVVSEPFTVELMDSNGYAVDAPAGGTVLGLGSSSVGGTFSLTGSGAAVTTLTVPAGMHTGTFYYQDSLSGTAVVTVSNANLTSGTQGETVAFSTAVSLPRQSGTAVLSGSGTPLVLNGVNLAGWLEMEGYMVPLDGEPNAPTIVSDMYTAIAVLDSRFGVATEQQLFRTYQSTWITDADLQNCQKAGFNVLRVPFWWANLYTTDFQWRPDAFQYLDWVVQEAAKYGLYVILELHGTFGGQSGNIYTGTANLDRYWENAYYQNKTNELWTRVATHYRYNNNVLGYDLLNEPDGGPQVSGNKNDAIAEVENNLYTAVRAVDTGHMIVMEETGGTWNSAQLPNPSVGGSSSEVTTWQNVPNAPAVVKQAWTNVAYSFHSYPPYDASLAQSQSEVAGQNSNFSTVNGYKVPDIIGECNYYNVEQSWYYAYSDFRTKGIHTIFWALKATNGSGEDNWGYYNENGWAWGGPEGIDGMGNYPNGALAALYTPNLLMDSAQTIANDWAAFTTDGSQNVQLGMYPNTPAYQANFHYNYAMGDPITEILLPQTAIAAGLLPPTVPPANRVTGVNFGFENPFVSDEADGGDAPDYRTNFLPDPQTVSAGWTFTGNSGITSTGLQTGAYTGWGQSGTEIVAPQGQQVAYLSESGCSFSQAVTSGTAGVWTITFSAAQKSSTEPILVSLSGTQVGNAVNPSSTTYKDYTVVTSSTLAAGSYTLAFTGSSASNMAFIDDVRVVVGTPSAAPVVATSGTSTTQVGFNFDYTITGSNLPTAYSAAGLPAGLSVNTSTGLISGKPTTTGTSLVTLSAANASGSGTQTMTIIVVPEAPYLSYSASGGVTEGNSYSYRITAADGSPILYEAYDMPAGLSVNTSTGYITGTATVSGTFSVLLVASNAGGTAEEVLTLTVNPTKPVITSAGIATATQGAPFSYGIAANYQPTSFTASGVPAWLSLNSATGLLSGTPNATGTSTITLSAINSSGTGTKTLTLTVEPPAPVITSTNSATGGKGLGFTYPITASNGPVSFTATGLPGGLTYSGSTGIISGTATVTGTFPVNLSATNAGGTGSGTLTLTILSAYNYWASDYFTPLQGTISGPSNMPESDGVNNGLKYIFDINPMRTMNATDLAGLPIVSVQTINNVHYLTLTYRQNPEAVGAIIGVRTCTDLQSWAPVTPDFQNNLAPDPATGDPMVEVGVKTNGNAGLFMDLDVTIP